MHSHRALHAPDRTLSEKRGAALGTGASEVNMAIPPLCITVRMWIHRGLEAEFEAYERKVSRIMARYGGLIERAIRTYRTDDGSDEPFELHLLKFPSRNFYEAYRHDAERRSLSGERDSIITNTDILIGTPGPTYGP
jgi:antibiotic biosynthesis monooxygenase (ABM) superfamily enzyme